PNQVNTSYSYDDLDRLLSVLHQVNGGATIDGATYTLDAVGNRKTSLDQRTGLQSNYSYDNIYQLTQVTQGAAGTSLTESYTYDLVGNRQNSLASSLHTVNDANELTATSAATYTFDANGNTETKTDSTGQTVYTWDFENRLTSVQLPGTG